MLETSMLETSDANLASVRHSQMRTDNLDDWNQMVTDVFCPMRCTSKAEQFSGAISLGRLQSIGLATIGGVELKVSRNAQHISQVTDSNYLVKFQLRGRSRIVHRGHDVYLEPGDFVICSSNEPYKLYFPEDYKQAVLSIPREQLDDLVTEPEKQLGRLMSGEDPVNGMLTQFVYSLAQRYDALKPNTLQRLEANVLDLLVTCLDAQNTPELARVESTRLEHLARIKQFITMHLQDTRLNPDFIAKAEGIGTRYLHMLFKEEALSVSRYIQLKRLEACGRMLVDPLFKKLSTMDVAFKWGFNDISHFHRCFKTCFGVTPRQYRIEGGADLVSYS